MNLVPQFIKNAIDAWAEARIAYAKRYTDHQLGS